MTGHTRNEPNITSNLDPKHYQRTMVLRGMTEADDAGYGARPQPRLPSDQVLTGADPKILRDLTEVRTADQASPVAA